jgi:hypothetical protein
MTTAVAERNGATATPRDQIPEALRGQLPPAPPLPASRPPTCTVAPPCILIAGGDGSGKSYTAAVLTASDKVGRSFWLELGETTADEYGLIDGTRYQPLVHDGTWAQITTRVDEVYAYAKWVDETKAEKPVVLVLDGMSAEWDLHHAYVDARNKANAVNRKRLAEDPNAELVKAGRHIWNDANDRHGNLMTKLVTFPGIVIMTARAEEVSDTDPATGQPFRDGRKVWRVDAQRGLRYQARCTIKLERGKPAQVVSCRSVSSDLVVLPDDPPQNLPKGWTLESLIFDMFKYDPATSHARELITPVIDMTPEQVRDEACNPYTTVERLRVLRQMGLANRWFTVELQNGEGDDENLIKMIERLGRERAGKAGQKPSQPEAAAPASGHAGNGQSAASAPPEPAPAGQREAALLRDAGLDQVPADPPAAEAAPPAAGPAPGPAESGGQAAAAEPVADGTDPQWLAKITAEIAALKDPEGGLPLWNKVLQQWDEGRGRCSSADKKSLATLIQDRVNTLRGGASGNGKRRGQKS